jgi:hypothetical protein
MSDKARKIVGGIGSVVLLVTFFVPFSDLRNQLFAVEFVVFLVLWLVFDRPWRWRPSRRTEPLPWRKPPVERGEADELKLR